MSIDALSVSGGRTSNGAAPGARRSKARRSKAWLGLVPFFAFLFLFLLLPTYGVIRKAFIANDGSYSTKGFTNAISKEGPAFIESLKLSFITAGLGVVFGTSLAYAAATARRPKWLRSLVASFSGVAANMGGVILAFLFLTLLGRQGLATKMLTEAGWNPYKSWFNLNDFSGWVLVYMYFQIPLMVLVTLPAIDGLRPAWREASANLGGTTWTYWRRVGLPVLAPSMLGGFLLLFANAFSAFATAYALNTSANLVPVKISFFLQGDVTGRSPMPFALATWMIMCSAVSMGGDLWHRRRAESGERGEMGGAGGKGGGRCGGVRHKLRRRPGPPWARGRAALTRARQGRLCRLRWHRVSRHGPGSGHVAETPQGYPGHRRVVCEYGDPQGLRVQHLRASVRDWPEKFGKTIRCGG